MSYPYSLLEVYLSMSMEFTLQVKLPFTTTFEIINLLDKLTVGRSHRKLFSNLLDGHTQLNSNGDSKTTDDATCEPEITYNLEDVHLKVD